MRLCLAIGGLIAAVAVVAPVGAQRVDRQTALGRLCASEIGLTGSHEECAAIHSVIARRAEWHSMRWITMARAYSSRVFDRSRTDHRAWVAHLRADGTAPEGWPAVASWRAARPRWLALHEAAGAIVRGEIESGCEGPIAHWGMSRPGSIDMVRAERAGWLRAACPEGFRNAFWIVPRRGDGEG